MEFLKKINHAIASKIGWLKLFKIFIGAAVFLSFFYVSFKEIDPDLGWHLKVGQWIYTYKQIPHFDEFTYTMPGHRWVAHEWFMEVIFWLAMTHNLWWMVCLFFALAAFLPFFFWLRRTRSIWAILYLLLAVTVFLGMMGVRPQILSFSIFFLCFEILYRRFWGDGQEKRKNLFYIGLPLLFFIWANLHAGFIAGLTLFMILFLVDLIWPRRTGGRINKERITNSAVLLISVAVTFINPYGLELYQEIFRTVFSSNIARYIVECLPFFYFNSISFSVLIGAAIFFILKESKRYRLNFLAAAIFFTASFLKSFRMITMFFVVTIPLIFSGIERAKTQILQVRRVYPFDPMTRRILEVIRVTIFLSVLVIFGYGIISFQTFKYPDRAIDFLKKYNQEKKVDHIFNDFGWGGYLIWKAPEIKIFIDGRMPAWRADIGRSAMDDYVKVSYAQNQEDWQAVFASRQIDVVFLRNELILPEQDGWLKKYLPEEIKQYIAERKYDKFLVNFFGIKKLISLKKSLMQNGWQVIYEDNLAVILKKP
jgi:hypothetical protein